MQYLIFDQHIEKEPHMNAQSQATGNLMELVSGYKQYAAAEELEFTADSDAPAATPTLALWSIATSKLFVSGAVSGAGAGASWRLGC